MKGTLQKKFRDGFIFDGLPPIKSYRNGRELDQKGGEWKGRGELGALLLVTWYELFDT